MSARVDFPGARRPRETQDSGPARSREEEPQEIGDSVARLRGGDRLPDPARVAGHHPFEERRRPGRRGGAHALFRKQAPCDHQLLDLARPFADRAELHVAVELLDRKVLDEAVPAVDLHRPVRRAHGDLARVELGLRGHPGRALAAVPRLRRALREKPRRVDLRGHLGDVELDRLELGDGPAELAPLLRVLHRRLPGAARHPDSERRDRDPPAVEDLHRVDEAASRRAEQVFSGDAAILHDEGARVRRPHAELVLLLADANAGVVELDDERGDPVTSGRLVGDGHEHSHLRHRRVRREVLRPVQNPVVAVPDGRRARPAGVRAGLGLGQAPRGQPLAARELRDVLLPLGLVPGRDRCGSVPSDVWAARESATDPSTAAISSMTPM